MFLMSLAGATEGEIGAGMDGNQGVHMVRLAVQYGLGRFTTVQYLLDWVRTAPPGTELL
jgi:hypothetical protein